MPGFLFSSWGEIEARLFLLGNLCRSTDEVFHRLCKGVSEEIIPPTATTKKRQLPQRKSANCHNEKAPTATIE